MNFDSARHNMVVEQLERRGITDPRVLEAMDWVPRHEFVPPAAMDEAYEDRALPIELEQTISQPYTVAFMCQEARIAATDKVLEIGTGSGYCAAVLSLLARSPYGRATRPTASYALGRGLRGWATRTSIVTWTMARAACRRRRRLT